MGRRRRYQKQKKSTSWTRVARWYDGMVGSSGSTHHKYIMPPVLDLLQIKHGEHLLDLGAGQGVLAPHIHEAKAHYIGVDISKSLIQKAQERHGSKGTFIVGNVNTLHKIKSIKAGSFDAAIFLLSIQDMRFETKAIRSAIWSLKENGRLVIFMTHPAFRIPRQSGWGYDERRKLVFRRIDSYLSKLDVPLRTHYKTRETLTRSYHRPLSTYFKAITDQSLVIDKFVEIPAPKKDDSSLSPAEKRALSEIPLFLGMRAVRIARPR